MPDDESTSQPAEPQLLIDHGLPVFIDGHWQIMSEDEHHELYPELARRTGDVTSTIEIIPPTVTPKPSSTKPATKTSSQSSTTPASTAVNSPLPSPFDGALAANFSGSCPAFIEAFLADPTFKACYPFSLLLQGSKSFFNAQKSFVGITRVLDATCAADVNTCTPYFEKLASDLVSDNGCADDYKKGNSLVVQAYMAMRAYKTLYSASCLTDAATSAYCFAYAVTDTTFASNVYLYYMPLNISYPPTQKPACNSCTKQTMGIYQAATADRYSAIATTYTNASVLCNGHCGAGYVNETLPEPLSYKNDAGALLSQGPATLCLLTTLFAMATSWWL
ncbi:uncharacterized protein B0I36DRAFT_359384 [Microdochium trichocladiopsis]|uniref:DUF7729 domain-containing protein n=1 Tax=Microdochium trichocladiopsis TaxID=1682393 RepID=A0A9P8YE91_9PEZI|nr:uncharacterized protein B0I36DRAFT_359384 [Microdochium trichocladiopsis]KAH7037728.1 hypothetical protein B0I36DRAFT_359384 [Microdochium trichocladiopsis]